ncbi:MAG: hypothetical protein KDK66_02665 [Deltaproteobacteria bacterium]|nr:hypothetical protein [Deltaproteobacteria bacterium]
MKGLSSTSFQPKTTFKKTSSIKLSSEVSKRLLKETSEDSLLDFFESALKGQQEDQSFHQSQSFEINGKHYKDLEDLPPEYQKIFGKEAIDLKEVLGTNNLAKSHRREPLKNKEIKKNYIRPSRQEDSGSFLSKLVLFLFIVTLIFSIVYYFKQAS